MLDEIEDFNGPVSLPGEPTEALPGSEQKLRIMTERAARREELFHPLDGLRRRDRSFRPSERQMQLWVKHLPQPRTATPEPAAADSPAFAAAVHTEQPEEVCHS